MPTFSRHRIFAAFAIVLAFAISPAHAARKKLRQAAPQAPARAQAQLPAPPLGKFDAGWGARFAELTLQSVGRPTARQLTLLTDLRYGELAPALLQWPSAIENTSGGTTSRATTLKALKALLLFANGAKIAAVETLLSIAQPEKVSPAVMNAWRTTALDDGIEWGAVNPRFWSPEWRLALGAEVESRLRSQRSFGEGQEKELAALLKATAPGTSGHAWLEWQSVALQAAKGGDLAAAQKTLAALIKNPTPPVDDDLLSLTAGRILYQNGQLATAARYYQKVSRQSDDWFDAQEELAWAQLRSDRVQDAIATTKSFDVPALLPLIGPDALLVRALAHLKICDYPEVARTVETYRETMRPRMRLFKSLVEQTRTPAVGAFLARARQLGSLPRPTDSKVEQTKLPRFISRDGDLARSIRIASALDRDSAKIKAVRDLAPSEGFRPSDVQWLEKTRLDLDGRADASAESAFARVKALANDELSEIASTLTQMQIIEAEIVQQVAMADRVIKATEGTKPVIRRGTVTVQGRDQIVFPDEGEMWFDELAHYKVDVAKGCQASTRSTLTR